MSGFLGLLALLVATITLVPRGSAQQWVSSRESEFPLNTVVAGDFGFLAGGGPSTNAILRSVDGVVWTKVALDKARTLLSIASATNLAGTRHFIALDDSGAILRTLSLDGPWLPVAQARARLNQVASRGALLVACGEEGIVLESVDAGATWSEVSAPVSGKAWRFLVSDGGSLDEQGVWPGFVAVAADGTTMCRDLQGRWVQLASVASSLPVTGLEWFQGYYWVFGEGSPKSWDGRFMDINPPAAVWVAQVLPFLQSTARYRGVGSFGNQAYAFGSSGLLRYDEIGRFPGLENILLPGESVGDFQDAASGRLGVVAVTDRGYVFRRVTTNLPPVPVTGVSIRPARQRLSEGDALFLELDIDPPGKPIQAVRWMLDGTAAVAEGLPIPGSATWFAKPAVTRADAGLYQAEVRFADGSVLVAAKVEVVVEPRPGIVWSKPGTTLGFSNILTGLVLDRSRWLLGGDSGLRTSTNGVDWFLVPKVDRPVYWLERIGGVCFAVGQSVIAKSDDGLNWTLGVGPGGGPLDDEFYGVVRWNGGYAAFGARNEEGGVVWTSADGIHWAQSPGWSRDTFWFGGATDGNVLVFGGMSGSMLRCHSDGSVQELKIPSDGDIYSIAYFRGRFFAVTSKGQIWVSTGGTNWTLQGALGLDAYVLRQRGDRLFVLGNLGGGVLWSADGDRWERCSWNGPAPGESFADVAWVDGTFRLIGSEGIVGTSQALDRVEVPQIGDAVLRLPSVTSPTAEIQVPVLSADRLVFEWWVDGAVVPGATGSMLQLPASAVGSGVWVWLVVRWTEGGVPVGPFRLNPPQQAPLEVTLNAPGGRLPVGSDLSVRVGGLKTSDEVRIRVSVDLDGDGRRGVDEPVVESFLVKDGVLPRLAGVRNPARPGDEDQSTNGVVDCRIAWSLPTEFEALPLPYLVECEVPGSPSSRAIQAVRPEGRADPQGVEGRVVDDKSGLPIPFAVVVAVQTEGLQPISAALTDSAGRFRMPCPSGGYWVFSMRDGFVAPIDPWPILSGDVGGDSLVLPGCFTTKELRMVRADAEIRGQAAFSGGGSGPEEELVLLIGNQGISYGQIGLGGSWRSRVVAGDWLVYNPLLAGGRMGKLSLLEGIAQTQPFQVSSGGLLLDAPVRFQRPERMVRVVVIGPDSKPLPGAMAFSVPTVLNAQDPLTDLPWSAWARTDKQGEAWLAIPAKPQGVSGLWVFGSKVFTVAETNLLAKADITTTKVTVELKSSPRTAGLVRFLDIQRSCCDWPVMKFGASFDLDWEVEASTDLNSWEVVGSGTTSGHLGAFIDGESVLLSQRFYRIRQRKLPADSPAPQDLKMGQRWLSPTGGRSKHLNSR
jgi:hypothetical protein